MTISFVIFNCLSSFLPCGGPFLESPDNYQHRKGVVVYIISIGVSNVLQKTWYIYHFTKQNGLVCWLGLAFSFLRFGFEYLFLGPKSYRDFDKLAPVQGDFRTGPTSPRIPFRGSFTIRNIIPARGSSWMLHRSENCILVRNIATASCTRRATTRFSVKSASC